MPEEIVEKPAAEVIETPKAEAPVEKAEDSTLLTDAGKETSPEAKVEETAEQKTAREADEKRLLEADDKTLKPEELAKKQALVKAQADAKANTVPEKYELKMPEGMEVDTKALDALTPVFKKYNLTQGAVQEIAETYAPIIKAQIEGQQKAAIEQWNKQGDDWKAESIKMLGSNAKTEMAFAAKFMDRFGGKEIVGEDGKKSNELRSLMQETKIGNHPVMLAAIIAAGKLLGEDKFVEGDKNTTPGDVSLYDHPTSKATLNYKTAA